MTSIAVIIVNWNGKKFIAECLDGLRRQRWRDFSITLVDNGSVDGSRELVQENYPEVKLIGLAENVGFAAANNMAIKATDSDYVALLNPDTVAEAGWLENLVKALEKHPAAGMTASKMLLYGHPDIIDRAGDVYTRAGTALLEGRGQPAGRYSRQKEVFGACAGAALYRRRMLDAIGLFDEDFFLLYEDVDLSFRAQLQGYKCLYVPQAVVFHKASSSIGDDTPVSVYYSHRNLEWVFIQNMPAGLFKKTLIPHLLYDLAAFLFFIGRGRGGDFIKAKWHALKGVRRALKKRSRVQAAKKVTDDYIWNIMAREHLLPRLTRRLKS